MYKEKGVYIYLFLFLWYQKEPVRYIYFMFYLVFIFSVFESNTTPFGFYSLAASISTITIINIRPIIIGIIIMVIFI